jgi:hypothetical protein
VNLISQLPTSPVDPEADSALEAQALTWILRDVADQMTFPPPADFLRRITVDRLVLDESFAKEIGYRHGIRRPRASDLGQFQRREDLAQDPFEPKRWFSHIRIPRADRGERRIRLSTIAAQSIQVWLSRSAPRGKWLFSRQLTLSSDRLPHAGFDKRALQLARTDLVAHDGEAGLAYIFAAKRDASLRLERTLGAIAHRLTALNERDRQIWVEGTGFPEDISVLVARRLGLTTSKQDRRWVQSLGTELHRWILVNSGGELRRPWGRVLATDRTLSISPGRPRVEEPSPGSR